MSLQRYKVVYWLIVEAVTQNAHEKLFLASKSLHLLIISEMAFTPKFPWLTTFLVSGSII